MLKQIWTSHLLTGTSSRAGQYPSRAAGRMGTGTTGRRVQRARVGGFFFLKLRPARLKPVPVAGRRVQRARVQRARVEIFFFFFFCCCLIWFLIFFTVSYEYYYVSYEILFLYTSNFILFSNSHSNFYIWVTNNSSAIKIVYI